MKKLLTFLLTGFLLTGAGGFNACSDYDDSALWKEIEQIKSRLEGMNGDIGSLRLLVDALQGGRLVLDVIDTGDGYKIVFSDGGSVTLNHGKDGGTSETPLVGVKEDGGVYYWTLTIGGDTRWMYDGSGNRVPVTGQDGHTPEISVDDQGYWLIDGQRLPDGSGGYVKASGGESTGVVQAVEQTETDVTITLADGTVILLQKITEIVFEFDRQSLSLGYGRSARLEVTCSGVEYTSVSKPDGWKAELYDDHIIVSSPARPNEYAEQSGTVSVVAVGKASTVVASLTVEADPDITGGSAGDSNWQDW